MIHGSTSREALRPQSAGPARELVVGVIAEEAKMRTASAATQAADAEFQAKRKSHLEATRYQCVFCSLRTRHAEVHHLDGDHANNDPSNYATACFLCHGYHHLGQRANMAGEEIGVALIPEVSAADLNLFLMAASAAWQDPKEGAIAGQVLQQVFGLSRRVEAVEAAYGVPKGTAPAHIASALARLAVEQPDQYVERAQSVGDLRIVPHKATAKRLGERFREEFSALPINSWEQVFNGIDRRTRA